MLIVIKQTRFKENLKKAFMEKVFKKFQIEVTQGKKLAELVPTDLLIDCIVWFDGEKWRGCLIPIFDDDFENIKALTNYRDDHEFSFILEHIAYCITIHDNGNSLEIFCPWHFHGPVVASPAASHFPNDPQEDGLAPGAQIVSLDINRNGMRMWAYKNAVSKINLAFN